jgi:hypothetical protein
MDTATAMPTRGPHRYLSDWQRSFLTLGGAMLARARDPAGFKRNARGRPSRGPSAAVRCGTAREKAQHIVRESPSG